MERFRAVKTGILEPAEVIEHDPLTPAVRGFRYLYGDTRDTQLPRVVDDVRPCVLAETLFDGAPVVHGDVLRPAHHAQRAAAGGEIVLREIREHILRKSERRELRSLFGIRTLRRQRRPVHRVAPAEEVAAGDTGGKPSRKPRSEPPVRHPRRRGADGVPALVQHSGEPEQTAQNAEIGGENDRGEEPADVWPRESQRNQQHIPEKERRRAFTGREPGLPLHGVQPAPEAEEHREFERRGGIAEPTGRRLRRNRGTQRKTRSGARKPRAAELDGRVSPRRRPSRAARGGSPRAASQRPAPSDRAYPSSSPPSIPRSRFFRR